MRTWLPQRIAVSHTSQIGEARRAASKLSVTAGFDEELAGRVAIVVTELATNLVRHATGGEILVQILHFDDRQCIEIVSIDRGPGMANVERCLGDGFSTNGTSGCGLGAVRRLSGLFDVWSQPGAGTVVVSRVGAVLDPCSMQLGVFNFPYPGETTCGDAWAHSAGRDASSVMVVDGLGHGIDAARAAASAIAAFREASEASAADTLALAHERMSSTRGGAVAIARRQNGVLRYAAVGNIAGSLVGNGRSRGLLTQNGTVGAQIRQLREMEYECAPGTLMVLHSDGLTTRWNLGAYPGLANRHPSLVAAVLFRDFVRGRDDVTVLAARWNS